MYDDGSVCELSSEGPQKRVGERAVYVQHIVFAAWVVEQHLAAKPLELLGDHRRIRTHAARVLVRYQLPVAVQLGEHAYRNHSTAFPTADAYERVPNLGRDDSLSAYINNSTEGPAYGVLALLFSIRLWRSLQRSLHLFSEHIRLSTCDSRSIRHDNRLRRTQPSHPSTRASRDSCPSDRVCARVTELP